ncbi:transmembrane protein 134-like isoform X2 [Acanthaster planci]|uniref:Transmembrane protein 134-like isoform X2 n=1 Tax=Acanthaster planci TaxID=133434 RepID=A0A8B7XXX3_ACAPL|nr:transmembrane protein 134-like isoform X2 [Acanthaster planci]
MSPTAVYFCLPNCCTRKPLIDGSDGGYQNKSRKESEYDGPSTANAWWWQHPDVRRNWKAVLGSIVMLIVGILLIAAGIVFEVTRQEHVACAIFIIIGVLFFIPGLYHTGYIYFAAKGIRGFDMNKLSIFNMSR